MALLAIVRYQCQINGVPDGNFDYQVRWFLENDIEQATKKIKSKMTFSYDNPYGQKVEWIFVDILDFGEINNPQDGEEIVGFTGIDCDGNEPDK